MDAADLLAHLTEQRASENVDALLRSETFCQRAARLFDVFPDGNIVGRRAPGCLDLPPRAGKCLEGDAVAFRNDCAALFSVEQDHASQLCESALGVNFSNGEPLGVAQLSVVRSHYAAERQRAIAVLQSLVAIAATDDAVHRDAAFQCIDTIGAQLLGALCQALASTPAQISTALAAAEKPLSIFSQGALRLHRHTFLVQHVGLLAHFCIREQLAAVQLLHSLLRLQHAPSAADAAARQPVIHCGPETVLELARVLHTRAFGFTAPLLRLAAGAAVPVDEDSVRAFTPLCVMALMEALRLTDATRLAADGASRIDAAASESATTAFDLLRNSELLHLFHVEFPAAAEAWVRALACEESRALSPSPEWDDVDMMGAADSCGDMLAAGDVDVELQNVRRRSKHAALLARRGLPALSVSDAASACPYVPVMLAWATLHELHRVFTTSLSVRTPSWADVRSRAVSESRMSSVAEAQAAGWFSAECASLERPRDAHDHVDDGSGRVTPCLDGDDEGGHAAAGAVTGPLSYVTRTAVVCAGATYAFLAQALPALRRTCSHDDGGDDTLSSSSAFSSPAPSGCVLAYGAACAVSGRVTSLVAHTSSSSRSRASPPHPLSLSAALVPLILAGGSTAGLLRADMSCVDILRAASDTAANELGSDPSSLVQAALITHSNAQAETPFSSNVSDMLHPDALPRIAGEVEVLAGSSSHVRDPLYGVLQEHAREVMLCVIVARMLRKQLQQQQRTSRGGSSDGGGGAQACVLDLGWRAGAAQRQSLDANRNGCGDGGSELLSAAALLAEIYTGDERLSASFWEGAASGEEPLVAILHAAAARFPLDLGPLLGVLAALSAGHIASRCASRYLATSMSRAALVAPPSCLRPLAPAASAYSSSSKELQAWADGGSGADGLLCFATAALEYTSEGIRLPAGSQCDVLPLSPDAALSLLSSSSSSRPTLREDAVAVSEGPLRVVSWSCSSVSPWLVLMCRLQRVASDALFSGGGLSIIQASLTSHHAAATSITGPTSAAAATPAVEDTTLWRWLGAGAEAQALLNDASAVVRMFTEAVRGGGAPVLHTITLCCGPGASSSSSSEWSSGGTGRGLMSEAARPSCTAALAAMVAVVGCGAINGILSSVSAMDNSGIDATFTSSSDGSRAPSRSGALFSLAPTAFASAGSQALQTNSTGSCSSAAGVARAASRALSASSLSTLLQCVRCLASLAHAQPLHLLMWAMGGGPVDILARSGLAPAYPSHSSTGTTTTTTAATPEEGRGQGAFIAMLHAALKAAAAGARGIHRARYLSTVLGTVRALVPLVRAALSLSTLGSTATPATPEATTAGQQQQQQQSQQFVLDAVDFASSLLIQFAPVLLTRLRAPSMRVEGLEQWRVHCAVCEGALAVLEVATDACAAAVPLVSSARDGVHNRGTRRLSDVVLAALTQQRSGGDSNNYSSPLSTARYSDASGSAAEALWIVVASLPTATSTVFLSSSDQAPTPSLPSALSRCTPDNLRAALSHPADASRLVSASLAALRLLGRLLHHAASSRDSHACEPVAATAADAAMMASSPTDKQDVDTALPRAAADLVLGFDWAPSPSASGGISSSGEKFNGMHALIALCAFGPHSSPPPADQTRLAVDVQQQRYTSLSAVSDALDNSGGISSCGDEDANDCFALTRAYASSACDLAQASLGALTSLLHCMAIVQRSSAAAAAAAELLTNEFSTSASSALRSYSFDAHLGVASLDGSAEAEVERAILRCVLPASASAESSMRGTSSPQSPSQMLHALHAGAVLRLTQACVGSHPRLLRLLMTGKPVPQQQQQRAGTTSTGAGGVAPPRRVRFAEAALCGGGGGSDSDNPASSGSITGAFSSSSYSSHPSVLGLVAEVILLAPRVISHFRHGSENNKSGSGVSEFDACTTLSLAGDALSLLHALWRTCDVRTPPSGAEFGAVSELRSRVPRFWPSVVALSTACSSSSPFPLGGGAVTETESNLSLCADVTARDWHVQAGILTRRAQLLDVSAAAWELISSEVVLQHQLTSGSVHHGRRHQHSRPQTHTPLHDNNAAAATAARDTGFYALVDAAVRMAPELSAVISATGALGDIGKCALLAAQSLAALESAGRELRIDVGTFAVPFAPSLSGGGSSGGGGGISSFDSDYVEAGRGDTDSTTTLMRRVQAEDTGMFATQPHDSAANTRPPIGRCFSIHTDALAVCLRAQVPWVNELLIGPESATESGGDDTGKEPELHLLRASALASCVSSLSFAQARLERALLAFALSQNDHPSLLHSVGGATSTPPSGPLAAVVSAVTPALIRNATTALTCCSPLSFVSVLSSSRLSTEGDDVEDAGNVRVTLTRIVRARAEALFLALSPSSSSSLTATVSRHDKDAHSSAAASSILSAVCAATDVCDALLKGCVPVGSPTTADEESCAIFGAMLPALLHLIGTANITLETAAAAAAALEEEASDRRRSQTTAGGDSELDKQQQFASTTENVRLMGLVATALAAASRSIAGTSTSTTSVRAGTSTSGAPMMAATSAAVVAGSCKLFSLLVSAAVGVFAPTHRSTSKPAQRQQQPPSHLASLGVPAPVGLAFAHADDDDDADDGNGGESGRAYTSEHAADINSSAIVSDGLRALREHPATSFVVRAVTTWFRESAEGLAAMHSSRQSIWTSQLSALAAAATGDRSAAAPASAVPPKGPQQQQELLRLWSLQGTALPLRGASTTGVFTPHSTFSTRAEEDAAAQRRHAALAELRRLAAWSTTARDVAGREFDTADAVGGGAANSYSSAAAPLPLWLAQLEARASESHHAIDVLRACVSSLSAVVGAGVLDRESSGDDAELFADAMWALGSCPLWTLTEEIMRERVAAGLMTYTFMPTSSEPAAAATASALVIDAASIALSPSTVPHTSPVSRLIAQLASLGLPPGVAFAMSGFGYGPSTHRGYLSTTSGQERCALHSAWCDALKILAHASASCSTAPHGRASVTHFEDGGGGNAAAATAGRSSSSGAVAAIVRVLTTCPFTLHSALLLLTAPEITFGAAAEAEAAARIVGVGLSTLRVEMTPSVDPAVNAIREGGGGSSSSIGGPPQSPLAAAAAADTLSFGASSSSILEAWSAACAEDEEEAESVLDLRRSGAAAAAAAAAAVVRVHRGPVLLARVLQFALRDITLLLGPGGGNAYASSGSSSSGNALSGNAYTSSGGNALSSPGGNGSAVAPTDPAVLWPGCLGGNNEDDGEFCRREMDALYGVRVVALSRAEKHVARRAIRAAAAAAQQHQRPHSQQQQLDDSPLRRSLHVAFESQQHSSSDTTASHRPLLGLQGGARPSVNDSTFSSLASVTPLPMRGSERDERGAVTATESWNGCIEAALLPVLSACLEAVMAASTAAITLQQQQWRDRGDEEKLILSAPTPSHEYDGNSSSSSSRAEERRTISSVRNAMMRDAAGFRQQPVYSLTGARDTPGGGPREGSSHRRVQVVAGASSALPPLHTLRRLTQPLVLHKVQQRQQQQQQHAGDASDGDGRDYDYDADRGVRALPVRGASAAACAAALSPFLSVSEISSIEQCTAHWVNIAPGTGHVLMALTFVLRRAAASNDHSLSVDALQGAARPAFLLLMRSVIASASAAATASASAEEPHAALLSAMDATALAAAVTQCVGDAGVTAAAVAAARGAAPAAAAAAAGGLPLIAPPSPTLQRGISTSSISKLQPQLQRGISSTSSAAGFAVGAPTVGGRTPLRRVFAFGSLHADTTSSTAGAGGTTPRLASFDQQRHHEAPHQGPLRLTSVASSGSSSGSVLTVSPTRAQLREEHEAARARGRTRVLSQLLCSAGDDAFVGTLLPIALALLSALVPSDPIKRALGAPR